ncbi:MAG: hypothetical protein COA78_03185 [Blastopirellula sp.]|nr:MAG: hypothetical protein COA78_03185 [Blastopirellula sp.]
MSKNSYLIPRRTMLKGIGAAVAMPMLEIMTPAILSAAQKQEQQDAIRFCVLYKGCGVYPHSWDIAGGTESDFNLAGVLGPLKHLQDDVLVLKNLDHIFGTNNGGHLVAPALCMTGELPQKQNRSYNSIDQRIAEQIGQNTPVKSLQMTADNVWKQHPLLNYLSHDKKGNPLAGQRDPAQIFDMLFRGLNNARHRKQTQSVLDDIKESSKDVLRKASLQDKQTLGQYFESIRTLEKQINQFSAQDDPLRDAKMNRIQPLEFEPNLAGKIKAMLDLIAMSFWTDTTRVVTMMMANTNSRYTYDFLGINEEFHYLSHYARNRSTLPHYNKINTWHTSQFAYLLDKLKSYKEGNSNVLDNSVILYLSGIKHGDYHTLTDIPVVLAGKGGGKIKTGRHVNFPEPTPFPNLLLTLANLMGAECDKIGESTGQLAGITSLAGFKPTNADDGSWLITKDDGKDLTAKGLLTVSDDINDTNVYYLQLSDKTKLEIRLPFLVVHKNLLDTNVGRVIKLDGTYTIKEGRKVISNLTYKRVSNH